MHRCTIKKSYCVFYKLNKRVININVFFAIKRLSFHALFS